MRPFRSDLQAVLSMVTVQMGNDAINYKLMQYYDRIVCPYCGYSYTLWELCQIKGEPGTRKAYRAEVCEECGTDGEIESYTY